MDQIVRYCRDYPQVAQEIGRLLMVDAALEPLVSQHAG